MVSTAGECSGTVAGREASATTLFKGFTFRSPVPTLSPSPSAVGTRRNLFKAELALREMGTTRSEAQLGFTIVT